jgi:predicted TIM-barrel fold metal-dependent hydrolase
MAYKLFSVDDHIMEPPDVWTARVARKYLDRVPHVVAGEKSGATDWVWDGGQRISTGLYAVAGKKPEEWNFNPIGYDDMIAGCYDPKHRAEDFLSNGICASAAFPTLPGFGGQAFGQIKDKELASVIVEAYNDFIIDEWCAAGPKGLFVPMILGKIWDPVATAKEIERCVAKGAKAVAWIENPVGLGMPSYWTKHWDPFWAVVQDADIPVCMHIGTGGADASMNPSPEAPETLYISLSYVSAMRASLNLAMSPVCRTFEKLKLVFSEGGLGWVPAAMERADFQWKKHGAWTKLTGTLPSEIIRRNMHFCMIQEPWAFRNEGIRKMVGENNIVWECDYPHADTPWPNTQYWAREMFDGVPRAVVEKAAYRNAERIFNWTCAELPSELKSAAE